MYVSYIGCFRMQPAMKRIVAFLFASTFFDDLQPLFVDMCAYMYLYTCTYLGALSCNDLDHCK